MKRCSIKPAILCLLPLLIYGALAGAAGAQPVPLRPDAPATTTPPASDAAPDAVSVGALPELDTGAAGTLTPENGGFPPGMWAGAGRALVEQLLPHVPTASPSPTLQRLARQLLLSAAELPQGKAGPASLLGVRAGLLAQMGDFEAVSQLAALAGSASGDAALLQARADSLLAANELDQACAMAAPIVKTSADAYWLRLSGFCQLRRGDPAAAQLTASLLNEADDADTAYQSLLAALIDKAAPPPKALKDAQPLHLAMLRMAALPLPEGVTLTAQAPALKMLARAAELDADLRIAAAERAEALGAITSDELAEIYAARQFSVTERADAGNATVKPGPRANALLYQSARQQDTDAGRALALGAAWAAARAGNTFAPVARANAPATRAIIPAAELLGIAGEASRALLSAGDAAAASHWYEMTKSLAATGNAEAIRTSQALWPLLRLAHPAAAMPYNPAELESWFDGLAPAARQTHGLLILSLLQALGFETPPAVWGKLSLTPLFVSRETPSAPLMLLLQDAGKHRRLGETVLISLVCLDQRLDDGFLLSQVIEALVNVGLQEDARTLALEAALFAGI